MPRTSLDKQKIIVLNRGRGDELARLNLEILKRHNANRVVIKPGDPMYDDMLTIVNESEAKDGST